MDAMGLSRGKPMGFIRTYRQTADKSFICYSESTNTLSNKALRKNVPPRTSLPAEQSRTYTVLFP